MEFRGRTAIIDFLATVPADGHLDRIHLQLTRASGDPAVAAWMPDETGAPAPYGLMVFTIDAGRIATINSFPDPALFAVFGLPG
ncbi:hypothetical protein [Kribbella catacumbae]|uniref:hypothetical protein n=1 Tax=Kribbella catacumbae TaxID=460086 RepID=UPI001ED9C572|nr:hypothetical protein [Kribbella catacumbae]